MTTEKLKVLTTVLKSVCEAYFDDQIEATLQINDEYTTSQEVAAGLLDDRSRDGNWSEYVFCALIGYLLKSVGVESFSEFMIDGDMQDIIEEHIMKYIEQIAEGK